MMEIVKPKGSRVLYKVIARHEEGGMAFAWIKPLIGWKMLIVQADSLEVVQ